LRIVTLSSAKFRLMVTLLPLFGLAGPMLLGQAGQVVLQLVDTVMIGRVGPVSLAGAALAGNLVMFALYFAYGAIGAVAPKVAQAFGKGDTQGIGRSGRAGLILGFAVGLFLAAALSLLTPFLGLLGQPPEVVTEAWPYLLWIAWSLPAAMLSLVLGQTAEAVNRPWPVLGFLALAVVVNVGLNYLLIFGNWGFPELGLTGAGLATFLARLVQLLGLAAWMSRDRLLAKFRFFNINDPVVQETLYLGRKGLPVAGQDVLEGGSFALGTLMLGWIGTTALAANQVTISIASLAWMFPVALATATSVRVAHAIGSGDLAAARRNGIAGVVLGSLLMAACAAVYLTSGQWLAGFFTDDPEVLKLTGILVTIAGIYQISDAIQSISLGALRGMMDNKVPMIANAICYWGLSLPTVYILAFPMGWGAVGVWVGYLPWMFATGVFFLWRFLRNTRSEG